MNNPRCVCGYFRDVHDASGKCPLCACGKLASEHGQVTNPPSPLRSFGATGPVTDPPSPLRVFEYIGVALRGTIRLQHICPGKPRTATGAMPQLRRGTFRDPPPPPRYERRPGWGDVLFPVAEPVDLETDRPQPRVPARYTTSLDEIAPAAMRVGKAAAAVGWAVDPWYAVDHDGTEAGALIMRHDDGRRVLALWTRTPGATWRTAGAMLRWPGQPTRKVGVKVLTDLLATG